MTINQFAISTRRTLRLLALSVTAALLTAFASQVSGVYAAKLGMPTIGVPAQTVFGQRSFATLHKTPVVKLPPAPTVVASAESFFSRSFTAIETSPALLVWSAYPASIRGQVFSGKTATDPFSSSSSGGW